MVETPQKKDWNNSVSDTMLMEWWNEFIDTQTMLTASLMRTLRPEMVEKEVVVKIPASKMEVLEAVKFPFNRFISERSGGRLTSLRPEAGVIVEEERMPYTDKEKLDYLVRKYPELENMIKKLGLRLP